MKNLFQMFKKKRKKKKFKNCSCCLCSYLKPKQETCVARVGFTNNSGWPECLLY